MRYLIYLLAVLAISSCNLQNALNELCSDPTDTDFFHCIPVSCEPASADNFFDGTFNGSKLCVYEGPSDSFAVDFYRFGYQFSDNSLLACRNFQATFYPRPLKEGDLVLAFEFKDTTTNELDMESFLTTHFGEGRFLPFSTEETTEIPQRSNIHGVSLNIGGYSPVFDVFYQHQLFESTGIVQPDWAYVKCTRFQKNGDTYDIELDVKASVPSHGVHHREKPYQKALTGKFNFKIKV
jgi:hypothetical protein